MAKAKRFYVYGLFRPGPEGSLCYIGKGNGKRWQRLTCRVNPRLNHIVKKAGGNLPKHILVGDLTESQAFKLEMALIALIGRAPNGPLVNLTDGGEGPSNPSKEVRAKIGAASAARLRDPKSAHHLAFIRNMLGKRSCRRIDHTGLRYNRLVGVKFVKWDKEKLQTIWLWKCDCGVKKKIPASTVTLGTTKSCGCMNFEPRQLTDAARKKMHKKRSTSLLRFYKQRRRQGLSTKMYVVTDMKKEMQRRKKISQSMKLYRARQRRGKGLRDHISRKHV